MSKQFSITLPDELAERVRAKAEGDAANPSISALIGRALENHLEEQERIRDGVHARLRAARAAASEQEEAEARRKVAALFRVSDDELSAILGDVA